MKKTWMMVLALILAVSVCAGAAAETPKTELTVFAAASLTESLESRLVTLL